MCLFWQAPKNEKQVPKKVSSSKACLVQFNLWTSDSEAEGLICVGFRGPVLKGASPSLSLLGACPIHLHLPFWKALKNEEKVSEKVGQACLAPVSPWTSDSEAKGLTCIGFRGPVLTLRGASSGLSLLGACPIHLHMPRWQAPKNEKEVPEKASSSKACRVPFSL